MKTQCSTYLSIKNISIYVDLNFAGLNRKAIRQEWLFTEKRAAGSPTRLYHLDALPDEIQIIWAGWGNQQEQDAYIREIDKGDKGRPDTVPTAITPDQAEITLGWPTRNTWKAEKGKKWDGHSRGLCPAARKILLTRFPELTHIQPGSVNLPEITPGITPRHAVNPGTPASTVQRMPQNQEIKPYTRLMSQPDEPTKETSVKPAPDSRDKEIELLKEMMEQKDQMIQLLQGTLADNKDTIANQKDFISSQKETIEMKNHDLNEKALEINDLKRELESAQEPRTDSQAC